MYIFLKSVFFPQEFWLFDGDQKKFWPKHLGVLSLFLEDMEGKTFKNCHNQIPGGMTLFWFPSEFSQNLSLFWETLVLDVNK